MLHNMKLTKARAKLILLHPFFGVLAMRMKLVEDNTQPAARTNGETIWYNSNFVEEVSVDELTAIMAQCVMHPAMLHHTRRNGRDKKKWDIACDYAINPIIKDAGMPLPANAYFSDIYRDKSAEEIYAALPDDNNGDGDGQGAGDSSGTGNNNSSGDNNQDKNNTSGIVDSQNYQEQEEQQWKQNLAEAMHVAKQQGKMPGGLERLVEDILNPAVPWIEQLTRFCTKRKPADQSWNRPQRRFIAQGIYLPSVTQKPVGSFVVAIDTSGSIDEVQLRDFVTELNGIREQMEPEKTYVIYADARVARVDVFDKHDPLTINPAGGGGTDFRPVFDYVEENNIKPDALIYLTDGYGTFPQEPAPFPTLWCFNSSKDMKAPWGENLYIGAAA